MPYDSYNHPGLNYDALAKRVVMLSNASTDMSKLEEQCPVSYTHLDVYKRQIFAWWTRTTSRLSMS